MGNLNKVLLIGRLGQDPEKRMTPAGHSVVNISLATTEYFKDQAGNRQERTEWHRVVFWNRQAEIIEQYTRKGSQIFVEGTLQTREWQDKDGNRRFSTDIIGRQLQLLDSKPSGNSGGFSDSGGLTGSFSSDHTVPDQRFSGRPEAVDNEPPGGSLKSKSEGEDFTEDDVPF
jgi:single-strand DNA-binding protein